MGFYIGVMFKANVLMPIDVGINWNVATISSFIAHHTAEFSVDLKSVESFDSLSELSAVCHWVQLDIRLAMPMQRLISGLFLKSSAACGSKLMASAVMVKQFFISPDFNLPPLACNR